MKTMKRSFSPALPCATCGNPTKEGFLAVLDHAPGWHLLPLCSEHHQPSLLKRPPLSPLDAAALRVQIEKDLAHLERESRRPFRLSRAFLRERQHDAPVPAQHALRRQLHFAHRLYRRIQTQVKDGEVLA